MAEAKKKAAATETKEVDKTVDTKAEEVKVTDKAETKPATKNTAAKKETVKKTTTAKKAPAAKKTPAKKVEVKEIVNFQFDGKSYTTEDLVKIAKDVWKYDHNMKAVDFKTVELYVKPEENLAYYVINGDVTGSFLI